MKIVIVDDNPRTSARIRGILSASKDIVFLEILDAPFAHQIIDFGLDVDVALIDLRFTNAVNADGDYDGLSVCQKIRNAIPNVVIVGYSTSFSLENEENRKLREKFVAMGADVVCPLEHLTLTPASELRYEFQALRDRRTGSRAAASRPKLFVGSSSEGLDVANRIQAGLEKDFDVVVWHQTPFRLGQVTIEALENAVREFQFAVFVFTPDDQLTSRNEVKPVARDNVIFEAGLFIGSLGRMRTFVVMPTGNGLRLPSDLAGLTVAKFDFEAENRSASLGPVCLRIRDAVNRVRNNDPSISDRVIS